MRTLLGTESITGRSLTLLPFGVLWRGRATETSYDWGIGFGLTCIWDSWGRRAWVVSSFSVHWLWDCLYEMNFK